MSKGKKSEHYVNNKEFLEALIIYKKKLKDAQENGLQKPIIPRYIGECFLKIATHLSFKPNFVNYIFKDDMISDQIRPVIVIGEICSQSIVAITTICLNHRVSICCQICHVELPKIKQY